MVKRALVALLLALACSATLFTQGLAAAAANDEQLSSAHLANFWRPWGRKTWPAFPPVPSHGKSPPGGPAQDPKIAKCFDSFKSVGSCLKPPIAADCCAALGAIQSECAGLSVGPINSAILDPLLKQFCSGNGGAPAPPA
ncbi:hypothetical protein QQP08_016631 [Theobroma cacao]|nr:hypothetical protein QQP08_016631 [Theobroma cacao]